MSAEPQASHATLRGNALRQGWVELLGRIRWEWFVTLTFDPKRVWDVDRELVVKEARWWCGQVARLVRRPVAWVIAPERGHGGRWHAHVLLVGLPDAGIGRVPEGMWRQRNGYIEVVRVRDSAAVAVYTTKSAALTGEIELSDTLVRYHNFVAASVVVSLYFSGGDQHADCECASDSSGSVNRLTSGRRTKSLVNDPIEHMAYHEAGHAVAADAFNIPIKFVTIVPELESFGRVEFRHPVRLPEPSRRVSTERRARLEAYAICALVGPVTQRIVRGRFDHVGSKADYGIALKIAKRLNTSDRDANAHFTSLYAKARQFVYDETNADCIDEIAHELLVHRVLSGRDVNNICRMRRPTT
jgi:hypothetical protein